MDALSQFEEGLTEVRVLLALSGDEDASTTSPQQDNALRRAGVVLLVSHFESYLKTLAEEFVDALDTGRLEARQIPQGIRELHTIPRMSEILSTKSDDQRISLLRKLPSITALWNESAKPPSGTLNPQLVARQVTNAHGETIDGLFLLMGNGLNVCDGDIDIENPDGGSIETANIRRGLEDVVKCRNDIAHGDVTRKPTSEDVSRYVRFLKALAERLERKADALTALYAS
jgi:hypothetical protein